MNIINTNFSNCTCKRTPTFEPTNSYSDRPITKATNNPWFATPSCKILDVIQSSIQAMGSLMMVVYSKHLRWIENKCGEDCDCDKHPHKDEKFFVCCYMCRIKAFDNHKMFKHQKFTMTLVLLCSIPFKLADLFFPPHQVKLCRSWTTLTVTDG